MRIFLTLLLWAIVILNIYADTLTVKLDGTGDYSSIQTAIGWSSSGDVILVYPGTYFENLDCFGRDSLTLASLFLLNPVDSNMHNTIIDGNQTGSCISAFRGEDNLRIVGFVIKNGSGTKYNSYSKIKYGGGFFLDDVSISIDHCIILENNAMIGGGISANDTYLFLSKTKICYNHAYGNGGGIANGSYEILFDTVNLCDLYLNTAENGTDYFQYSTWPQYPIVLDTATVIDPDHYYFACTDTYGFPACGFEFTINHAKIQDVSADIYVSPFGSDSNSGLTIDEPLKTLSFAVLKIKSDSLQRNTIHLSNGVYSTFNGNKFPIGLKSFVPIVGESIDNTVINLDSTITFGFGNSGEKEIIIKNFTIKNGMGDSLNSSSSILFIRYCNYILIDSILFQNCSGKNNSTVLTVNGCDSLFIQNSNFNENHVAICIDISGNQFDDSSFTELTSCKIHNNYPGPFQNWDDYGMGLAISNLMGNNSYMIARIINSEITENRDGTSDPGYPATSGVGISYNTIALIINSTIGLNTSSNPISGAVGIAQHSTVSFYNSIISGNNVHQILLYNTEPDMGCEVHLYNSLVENGENGICNLSPYSTVYYGTTNLDENPDWMGSGEFPYALLNDSPCINAGTQNLPEGIVLPDTDLMGGPRISGGEIDMGAYEFLFVGLNENVLQAIGDYLKVSPNPFSDKLTIYFKTSLYGKNIELDLYNPKGNLIVSVFHGKVYDNIFNWSPGNKDAKIKPGVYFLKCTIDSSITDTVKVIKI